MFLFKKQRRTKKNIALNTPKVLGVATVDGAADRAALAVAVSSGLQLKVAQGYSKLSSWSFEGVHFCFRFLFFSKIPSKSS